MPEVSKGLDGFLNKLQARVASIKSMADRHIYLGLLTPVFLFTIYLFLLPFLNQPYPSIYWVLLGMMSLFLAFDGGFYIGQVDLFSNRDVVMPHRDTKAKYWCYLHAQWCLISGILSLVVSLSSLRFGFLIQGLGWVGAALLMKRIFYWGGTQWSIYLTLFYHVRIALMLLLIFICWVSA